jgi:RNA polymerase sigma-70 factor, ECF subfamily
MTSRTQAARPRLWVVPDGADPQPASVTPGEGAPRSARLPAPTLDDSQLLASIRAGDPDAATALHDRLRPVAERAVRRLLGHADRDREDVVQQAILEVVTTAHRFRGDCPLDAWASTVTAHVVYKHIRRRVTERRIFESMRYDDDAPASVDRRSLSREAAARSTLRRVLALLDRIDEAKAWVYVLHDVCGYDLKEVAQITETSVAAAQSRLVRGRKELMERIAADPELGAMLARDTRGESS